MRTTISLPDDLFLSTQPFVGEQSFSHFIREAVHHYLMWLERERLARQMEEGYRAEAKSPSLDPVWSSVEGDGL